MRNCFFGFVAHIREAERFAAELAVAGIDHEVMFLAEALLLGTLGSALGAAGAIAYAAAMMYGLRTWWSGAVGPGRSGLG